MGAVFLALAVALPLVSQVELGSPLPVRATLAARERRDRLKLFADDWRDLVCACAQQLCLDPDAATRAVGATISQVLVCWRGRDLEELRIYVLCVLVRQCEFEVLTQARPADGCRFARLPLLEREVLLLSDRAGLADTAVAPIVGIAPTDVPAIRARAISALTPGGRSS
ncbi:MAG: hypothetical protein WAL50_18075 [Kineosporiaceae bacterium]